jgi:hypothetical protein
MNKDRHKGGRYSFGGAEGIRTPDPLHAMQVRYQLRHSPEPCQCYRRSKLVGNSPAKTFFVKTLRSRPQFQYADPADQNEIWGPTLTP